MPPKRKKADPRRRSFFKAPPAAVAPSTPVDSEAATAKASERRTRSRRKSTKRQSGVMEQTPGDDLDTTITEDGFVFQAKKARTTRSTAKRAKKTKKITVEIPQYPRVQLGDISGLKTLPELMQHLVAAERAAVAETFQSELTFVSTAVSAVCEAFMAKVNELPPTLAPAPVARPNPKNLELQRTKVALETFLAEAEEEMEAWEVAKTNLAASSVEVAAEEGPPAPEPGAPPSESLATHIKTTCSHLSIKTDSLLRGLHDLGRTVEQADRLVGQVSDRINKDALGPYRAMGVGMKSLVQSMASES